MHDKQNGVDLTDRQKQALDFTFAEHLVVLGERDAARREIGELRMALSQAAVESEALRSFNTLLESRVEGCVAERDEAVAKRAKLAALLSIMHTAMHEAAIEDFIEEPTNDTENAAH